MLDPSTHQLIAQAPCTRSQFIIVATNYLTKWVEAKATRKNDARMTAVFLFEYIFTRYGLPIEIVSDRGTLSSNNKVIAYFLDEFMVIHGNLRPIIHKQMDRLKAQIRSYAQH